MRILIAEDDAPLATFIAKAFNSEDHITEIAPTGDDALQRAQRGGFDLLILDLNLPVLSGSEVLQKVRSANTEIPILILTATDEVAERVACLDAGTTIILRSLSRSLSFQRAYAAVFRRKNRPGHAFLKVADLELDYLQRTVHRSGPDD